MYSTGRLLLTKQTSRWSDEQKKEADYLERRRVFKNFSGEDEGRCREFICECRDEAVADLIVMALNSYKKQPNSHISKMEERTK